MDLMRSAALGAIRLYQRWLSPHKGFACAYRVHTGRCSCSQLGFRAIRRFGVAGGWRLLQQRTALCGVAHRRHSPVTRRPPARERGDCDLGCDFDFLPGKGGLGLCDVFNCCDAGGCDWGSDKKKRRQEQHIHIPPYADLGQRRHARGEGATR